jgi:hypothetical protein
MGQSPFVFLFVSTACIRHKADVLNSTAAQLAVYDSQPIFEQVHGRLHMD